MRYTYRLTTDSDGITATCVEMSVSALGPTTDAAVVALRDAIFERLTRVEAVAPPDSVPVPSIQLVEARDAAPDREGDAPPEPQGPGDSPAADRVSPVRAG
ncbi:MAG TPA: hypothetical protein VK550_28705 [Polyangiaceae bacterium]|nr:hypothetical protein [Polyangiaceae bacterium]